MAHDDHSGHAHGPTSHAAQLGKKSLGQAWENIKHDVAARFRDGVNPHAKPHVHGHGEHAHVHAPVGINTIDKVAMAAGASVSLGVALHGAYNIKRGITGWEDKELGEKHTPSLQYLLVGAAETIAGLALMKRILTGTFRVF